MKFPGLPLLVSSLIPGACARNPVTGDKKLNLKNTDNGVTATTSVETGDGQAQPARISAIALGKKSLLMLPGAADKKHFKLVDKKLLKTGASLQKLDAAQVAAIKVPRLRIIPRGSQSFKSLAQQSAIEYDAVNILRLLNRSFPSGKIDKLSTLKTVTIGDD